MSESRRVLLVGGPRHGEFISVPFGQRDITFVTTPTCICTFSGDPPLPPVFHHGQERYRMIEDAVGVFEHESLWNANVERAAKRLDAEMARLGHEHNAIKKQRLDAEEREERILRRMEQAFMERDKLREAHGV